MINKRFEELKLSGRLPSPSGIGVIILRRTPGNGAPIADLVRAIEIDPALTGRLLKEANAALGPDQAPATTVQQAASRLESRKVEQIALSFSLASAQRASREAQFDFDRFWASSSACAVVAKNLCLLRGTGDPHDAHTCGLLIDIGTLALASVHPEAYMHIQQSCVGLDDDARLAAENGAFAIHHWEVTAALMEDSGLPERFIEAALSQSREYADTMTADEQTQDMRTTILAARRIAELFLRGVRSFDLTDSVHALELDSLRGETRLSAQQMEELFRRSALEWKESCDTLRIPTDADDAKPRQASPVLYVEPAQPDPVPDVPDSVDQDHVEIPELRGDDPADTTVLVIDDDRRALRLVAHYLEHSGYTVLRADSGEAGLSLALSENPDIVVTDWSMPGLSGIDVCKALRRSPRCRDAYVVVLTAREEESRLVEAFDAGADDYVIKPFSPRILLARVQAGRRINALHRQVESDRTAQAREVRALGLASRQLQSAVLTDLLTELPNRRYALTKLELEVEASIKLNRPLSLTMIDIDHFKAFNDRHGHDVGDHMLRATASILRSNTRRGDVVCRLGGEEFLVINVNSGRSGALMCAKRLCLAVERNELKIDQRTYRVTASLGVAERGSDIVNVDELLKAADLAVYQAKAAGRNTVRVLGDDGAVPESA